jgi:hypothetical protein
VIHSYWWYLFQVGIGCGAMALVATVGTLSVDWLLKRIDGIQARRERAANLLRPPAPLATHLANKRLPACRAAALTD